MDNIKVLYAEDEPALAKITSDTLRRNHFEVMVAGNGSLALEMFRNNTFQVCIIDIMLPKLDGYALVKEIRALNSSVPIIFLTARTLTEDVVKGFQCGGNDYLKKPYSMEELIVRLNELVRRIKQQPIPVATYQIGLYNFNHQLMQLSYKQEHFTLTHRESEIIKKLVERMGQVLNTDQILIELWGDNSMYNVRSLNVFITKIRKYFQHDLRIRIINIRAVGYKLTVVN